MTTTLKILSVCTNLPSQRHPVRGLFVARRLKEMAQAASLRALNPEPWFPGLRGGDREGTTSHCGFPTDARRMLYLPGIAKHWDAWWMRRCVERWLDSIGKEATRDAVLDAHFGYPEGVGCYQAARRRGIRIFITIRGLEVDLFKHPRIGPLLIEALNRADGVIAVSHSLRQAAVSAGVSAAQIVVIPNGVDTQLYSPGDRQQARKRLGIPEHQQLIVSVGSLKPVKGHDILIEAIARMRNHSDTRLVCIGGRGDSNWSNSLERKVQQLGLQGRIEFLGARSPDEVVTWLRAGNVFALASRREGCCNAVLEALACGVPVAATAVGDNAWFVKPGVNGELAPSEDVDALAQAVSKTLDSQYQRESIIDPVKNSSWQQAAADVLACMMNSGSQARFCTLPTECRTRHENSLSSSH